MHGFTRRYPAGERVLELLASVQCSLTAYCAGYDPRAVDNVAVFVKHHLRATCDPHVRVHEFERAEGVVQEGVACSFFHLCVSQDLIEEFPLPPSPLL